MSTVTTKVIPIQDKDIIFFKSGATGNCLGGPIHATQVGLVQHSLFNTISSTERLLGKTKYRCVYLKNNHPKITMLNPKLYITQNTASSGTELWFAFDYAKGVGNGTSSGVADILPDESTAPANVTFSKGTEVSNGAALGKDIPPGKVIAVWFRLNIAPNTEKSPNDGAYVTIELANEKSEVDIPANPVDTDIVVIGETEVNDFFKDLMERLKFRNFNWLSFTGNATDSTDVSGWINMLGFFKDKTSISFGPRDVINETMKNKLKAALVPNNPSVVTGWQHKILNNICQVSIDVTQPFEQGSNQWDHIEMSLKRAKQKRHTNFIIVNCNKAFYASLATNDENERIDDKLRRAYHEMFVENGVHVVISGQFRNYQRQHILGYNSADTDNPNKLFMDQAPNYIITGGQRFFGEGTGCLFINIGTGGRRPFHTITTAKDYTAFYHVPTNSSSVGYMELHATMRTATKGPTLTGTYFELYRPSLFQAQMGTFKQLIQRDKWSITIE